MHYRFYVITGAADRSFPMDFECIGDIGAMMHAGGLIGGNRSVEVWQSTRFVGEIGPSITRWSSGDGTGPARLQSFHS